MRKRNRDSWVYQLMTGFNDTLSEYGLDRVEAVLNACGQTKWKELLRNESALLIKPIPSTPEKLRKHLEKLPVDEAILTLAINAARLGCAFWLRRKTEFLHLDLQDGKETADALKRGLEASSFLMIQKPPFWACPFDANNHFIWDDWDNARPDLEYLE